MASNKLLQLILLVAVTTTVWASFDYNPADDDWAKWDESDDDIFDDEEEDRHYGGFQQQPNIVYILVDDWGFNDVGYHNPEILTPNIDKLAAGGLRLEQNYVNAVCTPSRSALMTGMDPYHIGRQRSVFITPSLGGLTLSRKLLPEYLQGLNYSTHMIGKWHLGHCNAAYLPTSRGFDTQYGIETDGSYNYAHVNYFRPFPYEFFVDDQIASYFIDPTEENFEIFDGFQMDLYGKRAERLIQEHATTKNNPMFMYLAFTSNHFPVEAPVEYLDLYPNVDDSGKRRTLMAMTSHFDNVIGNVVNKLKETKMYENTIIVVMGDNGGYLTELQWPGNPFLGGASNDPLRGAKASQYEGGTRVPALIHAPGRLRHPGRITNRMVHVTDWLPTLITAAGGDLQDYPELNDLDGKDQFRALFRGGHSVRHSFVYNIVTNDVEYPNGTMAPLDIGAIRYGRWKLINQNNLIFGISHLEPAGTFEMYDLYTDPTESTNVFDTYPLVAQYMVQKFADAAATQVPEENAGILPANQTLVCVTELGMQRTDFCNLDGTINE